jgi:two-component system, cell cycle sensor histidine kinase and response regulator CckA
MFKLLRPRTSAQPPAAVPAGEPPAPGPASTAGGLILVADDDELVRRVAVRLLTEDGFAVLEARDGHDAVEQFRQRPDDIAAVLLDMTMPGMSGEQVLEVLRGIRPDVKVILTSGYTADDFPADLSPRGEVRFLGKPWTADQLSSVLREVLAT